MVATWHVPKPHDTIARSNYYFSQLYRRLLLDIFVVYINFPIAIPLHSRYCLAR